MLAALLALVLGVQDPEPKPPESAPPPPQVAAPVVEDWDDPRTKLALKEFDQRIKGRSLKEKLDAIDLLACGRNVKLVAPLANVVARDGALTVRKKAAELLANQPQADARQAVARLLSNANLHKVPEIQATLVSALSRLEYRRHRDWEMLDGLFERDFAENRIPLQRAILALVKEQCELDALELLTRNLGEPTPENVDDASNPPAEDREARWKAWQSWRADVKEALLAITGQQFSTPKEVKAWLRENRGALEKRFPPIR